jgi:hypothetical protein
MTAAELHTLACTLKPNDVVLEHCKMRNPHTREWEMKYRSFRVNSAIVGETGVSIMYTPCNRQDSVQCGFGHLFISPVDCGNHRYGEWGTQHMDVIGAEAPASQHKMPNLYRNPGYDLVNM